MTSTDGQLLERLARGDMEALGALYDRHGRRVYHVLLAQGLEAPEADEVLPEVFLALAERGRKLRRVENVLGYVLGIARHLANRSRRRKGATASPAGSAGEAWHAGLAMAPNATSPGEAGPESSMALTQVLQQLPPEQAEVVVLKIWHGFTFAEIGETLRISANTAASRYRYGIEKLRGMWDDE